MEIGNPGDSKGGRGEFICQDWGPLTGVEAPDERLPRDSSGSTSSKPLDFSEGNEGWPRARKVDVVDRDGDTIWGGVDSSSSPGRRAGSMTTLGTFRLDAVFDGPSPAQVVSILGTEALVERSC